MDHHCHCPPADHHAHSPPPCEQQGSSCWNTPDHCHPPCPAPPPPPYEPQQDYFWNPAFQQTPFLGTWSSSSSDAGNASSCTVSVEKPPAGDKKAPLLETKIHGGAAAGPSGAEALFVLLFCAVVGGFVYWYWF